MLLSPRRTLRTAPALALAVFLISLATPVLGQAPQPTLEEAVQEESIRSFDQVDLDAIRQLAVENALAATVPEKAVSDFNCIPTCTPDDGRFLVIANGPIFVTLSDPILDLQIQVPEGTTSFSVGFFDGDGNEPFNAFGGFWDQAATAPFTYTLFADALANGADGDNSDDVDSVVFTAASATLPNNAWLDVPVTPTPGDDAQSPSGNYFYNLRIELTDLAITTLNAFKIRTSEIATIEPFAQPFSYIGQWTNPNDIVLIYPMFPSDDPRRLDGSITYDGEFNFFFSLESEREELILWGGDFDRGKFDGTESDTDDPDTPIDDDGNPLTPFPAWQTTDGVPEGVAVGSGPSTGAPPDDSMPIVTLGPFMGEYALRRPSVIWDLIAPGGSPIFQNLNPSGNQEWEQFVVSADPLCDSSSTCVPISNTPRPGYPCADVCTGAPLPAGSYEMRIRGVDMQNLNAIRLPERVVCVNEFGLPCSTLNPFLIGDTVFLDLNGNGVQDGGEPGIAGVLVNLRNDDGVLIDRTVTDASGNYTFNVPAGTFTVEIDDANFDPPAPGGALGDRVWLDVDGDGVQDAGEPGIPNVTVALFELGPDMTPGTDDDNFIATTQTGQGGNYVFADLAPGTYYVNVENETVPTGLAISGGTDPSATRTIVTDEVFLDLDFGYTNGDPLTAIVGDFVWTDDGDGIQEPGEPGIAGVTVDLIDALSMVVATAITGEDGKYLFTGVAPGTYTVAVTDLGAVLAGYLPVVGGESNPSPTLPFAVAAGDTILTKDFGYTNATLNSITDVVWLDVDRDGVLDGGESGIGGVRVNLVGPGGGVVATTTTAADGTFTFPDLPDGDYTLVITDVDRVLDGLLPTTQGSVDRSRAVTVDGADVSNTSFGWVADGALEGLVGTTVKDPVADVDQQTDTVVDDNVLDYDFGYIGSGSIGNRVWYDVDGDGVQDPGEPGINGVTVTLFDPDTGLTFMTTTSGDGNYLFDGLRPNDDYVVSVDPATLPAGLDEPTSDLDDPAPPVGTPHTAVVPLGLAAPGIAADRDDADFGYTGTGSIGNRVWRDDDGDGVQDAGEPGINGVTVELRDGSGTLIATTVTAGDGNYLFPNLPPGTYTVTVVASTLPPDLAPTFDVDGVVTPNRATVTIGVGEDRDDVDFGYAPCGPCEGKVTKLTLQYLGAAPNAQVKVVAKRGPGTDTVFNGVLDPGDTFDIQGPATGNPGFAGTLGTEIRIFVDGMLHTVIHTSCSQPIGPGLVSGDFKVIAGASKHGGALCPLDGDDPGGPGGPGDGSVCLPAIDFETDAAGNPLATGQIIDGEFAGYGIQVTTDDPVHTPAMIFDTSSPSGGDFDLGTPNQAFGGPGVGSGGGIGQPGENRRSQGKVLILSEDRDSSDPDDNAGGGTIIFTFDQPVFVASVDVLDIDAMEAMGLVKALDASDTVVAEVQMQELGDNSFQTLVLDASGVRRLKVHFPSSGALAGIVFCEDGGDCVPKTVRDRFSSTSFGRNDGPDHWSGPWIEDDPESGGAGPGSGAVRVTGGKLRLDDRPDTGGKPGAAREVDLSGALGATLSFDFATSEDVDRGDAVTLDVSSNGGATWHVLEVFTDIRGIHQGARSFDLSGFISAQTRIRFRVTNTYGGEAEYFFVDNVEITSSCEPCSPKKVRDNFSSQTFAANDGTENWSGNWIENDPLSGGAGPADGQVMIENGFLRLDDYPDTGGHPSAAREVDLSGAASATLRFDFETTDRVDPDDAVTVEMSADGGATWHTLEVFTDIDGAAWGSRSYDVSSFISARTQVRFRVSNKYGGSGEAFFVDFVKITSSCPSADLVFDLGPEVLGGPR